MSSETKRGEGAAEELGQEKGEEEAQERPGVKKDAAEVADKAKEKLGEAAGDAKKAVHSFIHDDKKLAKNQPYRDTGVPDSNRQKVAAASGQGGDCTSRPVQAAPLT